MTQDIGSPAGRTVLITGANAGSARTSPASSRCAATLSGADAAVRAAAHGYTTALVVSAVIFAAGAVVVWLLLPGGVLADPAPVRAEPAAPVAVPALGR